MTPEPVRWHIAGPKERLAVVELIWYNRHGTATPTGRVIARTDWDKLSSGARRVLENHGIKP